MKSCNQKCCCLTCFLSCKKACKDCNSEMNMYVARCSTCTCECTQSNLSDFLSEVEEICKKQK